MTPPTEAPSPATTPAAPEAPNPTPAGETAGTQTASPEPQKVDMTQDALNAKIGATRDEGRLSLAKKYGFETLEAFDAAMTAYKQEQDSKKSELDRYKDETGNLKKQTKALAEENRALKIDAALRDAAADLGVDPKQISDLAKLRDPAENEIDAEGKVDKKAIKASVKAAVEARPWLKGAPATIGAGANPASASATTQSLDQQIAEAQKAGNHSLVIALQMRKFSPLPS